MNKKILGIILCVIMLMAIPVAAGMQSTTSDKNDGIFGRTTVRGVILGSQSEGRSSSFFALFVHYTSYSLLGGEQSGYIIMKRVSFPGKFMGYMGKFYIAGSFWGTP